MIGLYNKDKQVLKQMGKYISKGETVLFLSCPSANRRKKERLKRFGTDLFNLKYKDIFYSEYGVGQEGINIAIKDYFKKEKKNVKVLAFRGKNGEPRLYNITDQGVIVRLV